MVEEESHLMIVLFFGVGVAEDWEGAYMQIYGHRSFSRLAMRNICRHGMT